MSAPRHVLTVLAVTDLDAAASFFERALGWRRTVSAPSYVELEGPAGARLGVYERHGFGRNTGRTPLAVPSGELAPSELYFHVDDLDAAVERAGQAGARVLSDRAPRDWGDEAVYFAGPDGHVLVLARPLPAGA